MPIFPKDQTVININNKCCNGDTDEIKEQLDRIESKLDQLLGSVDDEALRQEIWNKLDALQADIISTIS